jgi:hypothetical protein
VIGIKSEERNILNSVQAREGITNLCLAAFRGWSTLISHLRGRAGQTALETLTPPVRALMGVWDFMATLARVAKNQQG